MLRVTETVGQSVELSLDAPGTANDATFAIDALGRFKTRTIAGASDTYSYLGTSETVTRIVNASTADSLVDATGGRLGVKVGGSVNWFLPDPHGNVAGSLSGTTIANALRYDAYGQTLTTGSAGGTPVATGYWKHQGRLDVSPPGLGQPLYDAAARLYSPGLGTFTSLDTFAGTSQDPLSLNRYLYAEANPATLVDPTGHAATRCDGGCGTTYPDQIKKEAESAKQAAKQAYDAAARTNVSGAYPKNGPSTSYHTPEDAIPLAIWDSVSNMAINTFTGTYDLVSCGGINAFNPVTCDQFDENVQALTDQGYRNERLQAQLYALANGFGDAQQNLTSGDLYRTTRAVTDVTLFAALAASGRSGVRLAGESSAAAAEAAAGVGVREVGGGAPALETGGIAMGTGAHVAGSGARIYLYQKLSAEGEHLKYGITKSPETRYTSVEMNGGRLNILASGTKAEMLALERLLHEWLPIRPEEGQRFYIEKQIANGLRPPPYSSR